MNRTEHTQQSMKWNMDREKWLRLINTGIQADHIELPARDPGGWRRVSRHSASTNSAYKCMAVLRLQWPDLEFQVRTPATRQRWKAEIWARARGNTK